MDILRLSIVVEILIMKRLKICLAFVMLFFFTAAISQIKKPPLSPPPPPPEIQMEKPTEPQKVISPELNYPPTPPRPPIPPPPPPPPKKD